MKDGLKKKNVKGEHRTTETDLIVAKRFRGADDFGAAIRLVVIRAFFIRIPCSIVSYRGDGTFSPNRNRHRRMIRFTRVHARLVTIENDYFLSFWLDSFFLSFSLLPSRHIPQSGNYGSSHFKKQNYLGYISRAHYTSRYFFEATVPNSF